jgi:hypothetical protein
LSPCSMTEPGTRRVGKRKSLGGFLEYKS